MTLLGVKLSSYVRSNVEWVAGVERRLRHAGEAPAVAVMEMPLHVEAADRAAYTHRLLYDVSDIMAWHVTETPYNPTGQAGVERSNKTLEGNALRTRGRFEISQR